jgi:hypothetical protein
MESDAELTDARTAAARLAALRADRAQLAERARQPWWYDPALGLLVFVVFAAISLQNVWLLAAAVVVFVVGLRLLMRSYRQRTGFWVNGLRAGRTQTATRVWFLVYGVVVVPAAILELMDVRGALAVAGAVLGIGIALISRWWTTIYIAELKDQQ